MNKKQTVFRLVLVLRSYTH